MQSFQGADKLGARGRGKRAGSRYAVRSQERDYRHGSGLGRLGLCFSAPAARRNQLEGFYILMDITHRESDLPGPEWGPSMNNSEAP